eukprot:GHVP01052021.1.p1 GENE.GHVP01052021.1~~GHVP01052021.1.p1  ORF type:complete len:109 (-),score=4.94 GHVP01052021.1:401-727(-)
MILAVPYSIQTQRFSSGVLSVVRLSLPDWGYMLGNMRPCQSSFGVGNNFIAWFLDSTGRAPSLDIMCPKYFRDWAPKIKLSRFIDEPVSESVCKHFSVLSSNSSKVPA